MTPIGCEAETLVHEKHWRKLPVHIAGVSLSFCFALSNAVLPPDACLCPIIQPAKPRHRPVPAQSKIVQFSAELNMDVESIPKIKKLHLVEMKTQYELALMQTWLPRTAHP